MDYSVMERLQTACDAWAPPPELEGYCSIATVRGQIHMRMEYPFLGSEQNVESQKRFRGTAVPLIEQFGLVQSIPRIVDSGAGVHYYTVVLRPR